MDQPNAKHLEASELAALLHFYQDAGVDWMLDDQPNDRFADFAASAKKSATGFADAPVAAQSTAPKRELSKKAAPPPPPVAAPVVPDDQAIAQAAAIAASAQTIEELANLVAGFAGCNLRNSAKSTAFIDGDAAARIMVIGPVSSAEDDRDGIPFAGRMGEMLERMLGPIGLSRQNVLLANIIPWRPPGNRAPSKPEMDICRPFVERLMALAKPEAILLMGNFSARFFLDVHGSIHALRGRWHELATAGGPVVPVLATFHPQDLLQAPLNKPLAWNDLLVFAKTRP